MWCAREDSNLHPFRDQILSLARLPFRHARNRAQNGDPRLKSQAVFAQMKLTLCHAGPIGVRPSPGAAARDANRCAGNPERQTTDVAAREPAAPMDQAL